MGTTMKITITNEWKCAAYCYTQDKERLFNGFYNLFSVNYLIFIDIIGLTASNNLLLLLDLTLQRHSYNSYNSYDKYVYKGF